MHSLFTHVFLPLLSITNSAFFLSFNRKLLAPVIIIVAPCTLHALRIIWILLYFIAFNFITSNFISHIERLLCCISETILTMVTSSKTTFYSFAYISMPHNIIILYFRLPYLHASNSPLLSALYLSALILHRRSLETFYWNTVCIHDVCDCLYIVPNPLPFFFDADDDT